MNVEVFKCNPNDTKRFVEALNRSLSGRIKENWQHYNPNSDSERVREAKQTSEAGKIAYEFLQNLLKKQGKFTANDYQAYLKYCQELGINNVLTSGGFNYAKTRVNQQTPKNVFQDELYQKAQANVDGQKLTVAETAAQPVNTAPISKSLENLLNYVEEQGDKLAETAEVTCHKKYQMVYDTVAMAVSGAVMKNSAIIAGQAGVGKCVRNSTKVPLADGSWTTMGKIKKGDMVLTPKGTTAKVLEVYPQPEKKDVYRVTLSDGRYVDADKEQIFKVKRCRFWWDSDEKKRKAEYKYDNETLETLITAWERESKYNHGKNSNKPCFSLPLTKPVDFQIDVELPIPPYILGLLLGDGGMSSKSMITFTTTDKELLEVLKEYLKTLGMEIHQSKTDPIIYRLVRVSESDNAINPLLDKLRDLGLQGTDCFTKFIPAVYKTASKEDRLELIRGLMDTDGTIGTKQRNTSYCTVSKELAKDFAEIIYSLGGRCSYRKVEGRESQKEGSYFYDVRLNLSDCPFKLERKVKRYNKIPSKKRNLENICIKSIEYVGKDDTTCILIDDPEHLYLVNDYVVVHNTYSATKVLADRGFKRILEGNPGQGEYLYNNGSIGRNQESIVWFFYTHRNNEIIVMDDCDSFLTTGNDSINNMLKALLTTGKQGGKVTVGDLRLRRKLSKLMKESTDKNYALNRLIEGTANNQLREQFGDEEFDRSFYGEDNEEEETIDSQNSQEGEDNKNKDDLSFPSTFEFTSKLICISNLHLKDIDNAVTSRSNCCEIYLTPEEFMVKLNEVKDQLGNDDCRVPLDVYLWHKDVCLETLNIALECWKTGRKVAGRSVQINSPLEFRIITALADYSIAKTTINGIDVLKMTDNQRTAHIYRMLTENCIDMLAQVK